MIGIMLSLFFNVVSAQVLEEEIQIPSSVFAEFATTTFSNIENKLDAERELNYQKESLKKLDVIIDLLSRINRSI